MKIRFTRNPDLLEAGDDYGWGVTLLIRGRHRARWNSTRATTSGWPTISRGADENCNRAVTLTLWPLGSLDVWWETRWRTDADGMCDDCLAGT